MGKSGPEASFGIKALSVIMRMPSRRPRRKHTQQIGSSQERLESCLFLGLDIKVWGEKMKKWLAD